MKMKVILRVHKTQFVINVDLLYLSTMEIILQIVKHAMLEPALLLLDSNASSAPQAIMWWLAGVQHAKLAAVNAPLQLLAISVWHLNMPIKMEDVSATMPKTTFYLEQHANFAVFLTVTSAKT